MNKQLKSEIVKILIRSFGEVVVGIPLFSISLISHQFLHALKIMGAAL